MTFSFPPNRDRFFEWKKGVSVTAHRPAHGRSQPLTFDAHPAAHAPCTGMNRRRLKKAMWFVAWVGKDRPSCAFLERFRNSRSRSNPVENP